MILQFLPKFLLFARKSQGVTLCNMLESFRGMSVMFDVSSGF